MASPVTHSPLPPPTPAVHLPRTDRRLASERRSQPSPRRAAELVARLPLEDGLRICLSLADEGSPYFSSAALRCHSRLLESFPQVSIADAQAALAALAGLRGSHRQTAAETLREIYGSCEQEAAAAVLDSWLTEGDLCREAGIVSRRRG